MSAFSINTAILLVACFYSASFGALAAHRLSNGQLKSVNSYPGACPYSSAGLQETERTVGPGARTVVVVGIMCSVIPPILQKECCRNENGSMEFVPAKSNSIWQGRQMDDFVIFSSG